MGFMDKVKGAAEKAQAAMPVGASGDQIALANKANKLAQQGVATPAHIDSMTATGNTDATNSIEYDIKLTVSPAGGPAYEATTLQYVHPASATTFVEGADVTVRVDPDDATQLLLWGPA
jgi:hypothetical protein